MTRSLLAAAGSWLLAISAANAQTVWDGSESGSWANGDNWVGGVAPTGGALTFSGTANQTNTNDAGITSISTLTLSNAGWDIDLGATAISITSGITATGSSMLNGNLFMNNTPRTITLNGTNSTLAIAGDLNLNRANDTVVLNVLGAGNTLELSSLTMSNANSITRRTINNTADVLINGNINSGGGNNGLNKNGAGTMTVQGNSALTLATTINEGTFLINGSTSTALGAVFAVGTSGTLGGIGTVGGATTIDGVLAPGQAGIGTFTVNNDLTWNGGVDWKFELGAANTSDRLALTGVGSDLLKGTGTAWQFDFLNSSATGTFTLATWTGTTTFSETDFDFTNYAPGGSFSINSNSLFFTTIPEPSTLLLGSFGLLFLLRRRREAC